MGGKGRPSWCRGNPFNQYGLTKRIAERVSIPVIASGGAGKCGDFYDALTEGKADAALAASLFHYKELEICEVKEYLASRGVPVRIQDGT